MYTYFIQAEEGGLIKIGTAISPLFRLRTMQTGCPLKLRLIGLTDGDRLFERGLHKKFEGTRVHGEWFEPSEELLALVAECPVPDVISIRLKTKDI